MRVLVFLLLSGLVNGQTWNQTILDDFAKKLTIKWAVVSNIQFEPRCSVEVSLMNNGSYSLSKNDGWKIFFNNVRMLEPGKLSHPEGVDLEGQGIKVRKYQGSLFSLEPTKSFLTLPPNSGRKIKLKMNDYQVLRISSNPNWYLNAPGLVSKVIQSTVGEELSFVEALSKPQQVKRYNYDRYSPFTAQERYRRNKLESGEQEDPKEDLRIIPRPLSFTVDQAQNITVSNQTWRILAPTSLSNEAAYLTEMSGISIGAESLTTKIVRLSIGDVEIQDGGISGHAENYALTIEPEGEVIEIRGQGVSGVMRGVQTLLSLLTQQDGVLYKTEIVDSPRYAYRGLHLDVARNFFPKSDVIRLLGNMAMYKLNKLHLHLADDEGWRLEIPGLEELTGVGSRRCHDPEEHTCLLPQLGSGPDVNTSGSGYYTTSDYKDILREAAKLHIQVIPEYDSPGHARAAIRSMEARYDRLMKSGSKQEALKYRLVEDGDTSKYESVQMYTDNAFNPCLESTYTFIEHVVDEVKKLHEGIQPLTLFHFGGDEVGEGAWSNSPLCRTLFNNNSVSTDRVKELFFTRVANITARRSLGVAGWEDGLAGDNQVFDWSHTANEDVVAFVWQDTPEVKRVGRAYEFANKGLKVVLASAMHLYISHPAEPDPEEQGHFWATRYIDNKMVFSYTPEDLYSMIDVTISGETTSKAEVCGEQSESCPPLQRPENIVGLEGCLWSETFRERKHIDQMAFPRLLSLAERAWHKASWEGDTQSEAGRAAMNKDWESFVRHIGQFELRRLDRRGVEYRIPPPGAISENGFLEYSTLYPGLSVQYSKDGGTSWFQADNNVLISPHRSLLMRTRSTDLKRSSRVVTFQGTEPLPMVIQSDLDYMAENLNIKYKVLDNFQDGFSTFLAQLSITNGGERDVVPGNWGIYFCSIYMIPEVQAGFVRSHVTVTHIQGCLFKLEPTSRFKPLKPRTERRIKYRIQNWSVSRTDSMPNWYVWAEGMDPRTIVSTRGPDLDFVEPYSTVRQWKRYNSTKLWDRYNPYTPGLRYTMSEDITDMGESQHLVIPTPVTMVIDEKTEPLLISSLKLICTDLFFANEAHYLKDELAKGGYSNLKVTTSEPPSTGFIQLIYKDPQVIVDNKISSSPEAYSVTVDPASNIIRIMSTTAAGIFNGVQSVLSLVLKSSKDGRIQKLTIEDAPRYEFRGMYLDVCRNFHSKQDVMDLLDVMASYKLNKLHLHLTEDEGWRIEIPGLEELTQIGGNRCHDLTEETCVISQLGSGPDNTTSGSGFYTIEEYQDILRYAAVRHIEVIPEVESPGHAHTAVASMKARHKRLMDIGDSQNADKFTLHDKDDKSVYQTNQLFNDNVMNPCIPSTYTFFSHIVDKFIEIHKNINDLKSFHFGGDEVPEGTWAKSPACQNLMKGNMSVKEYFTLSISNITAERGLNLAGWEDSMMESATRTFSRESISNREATANAWNNVWEWGSATRAHVLANNGYKVVLSHATHLYFDHPYEPDPKERGFYWATRYADTYKTYGYLPDRLYDNVDVKLTGEPMTKEDLCGAKREKCPVLEKPENIIGMQGHLWSETVRTPQQLFYMIFPRLLAVAERAWHKAEWEDTLNMTQKRQEWIKFVNTLGYQELPALDKLNITYRIPLPGAKLVDGRLRVVSPFPGLQIVMSTDGGRNWKIGSHDMDVPDDSTVLVALRSADGRRRGRAISMEVPGGHSVVQSRAGCLSSNLFTFILCILMYVQYSCSQ